MIRGSWPTEVPSKETYLLNIFLAPQFKFKDLDLEYFLLRFLDLITHQEVPKLFFQQELRGLVDKTTAQQTKVQQFETDRRQGLGLRKFSVKIPPPYNSSGSSKIKIILSRRSRRPDNPRLSSSSPPSSRIGTQQQRHLVTTTTIPAASQKRGKVRREKREAG